MGVDQTVTSRDDTQRRDEMMVHGVRGLLIINGGGAVALLTFLQAIWGDYTTPRLAVIIGLILLLGGTALAGSVMFIRYHTTFKYALDRVRITQIFQQNHDNESALEEALNAFDPNRERPTWTRYTAIATWGSLAFFLAGTLTVAVGAWLNIAC